MAAGTRANPRKEAIDPDAASTGTHKRKDVPAPEQPVATKKKKSKSKEGAAHNGSAHSPSAAADKGPQLSSKKTAPINGAGKAGAPRSKKHRTAEKDLEVAGKRCSAKAVETSASENCGQTGRGATASPNVTGNTQQALAPPRTSPSEHHESEKHTPASPARQPSPQDVSHRTQDNVTHTTSEADKDKLIALLQARLDEKDAKVRKHLRRAGSATDKSSKSKLKSKKIKPIKKPKGEAGNPRRGGYVLQQVMRLDGAEDKQAMYTAIQDDIHRFCAKYDIDFRLGSYNQQCKEKLAKVFRATYRKHSYMTPERFPSNWATGVIVQQYINGQRKAAARKKKKAAKLAASQPDGIGAGQASASEDSSDEDDDEEDGEENGDGEGEGEDGDDEDSEGSSD